MTLSSNTAQTREIGELRNHLKWMDEERRKSGRKMTELEQRLAQQGREVAERDQKIQELEYHLAALAERLERIPENDPNAATQEQRLQDLEWHLSNLSAQLTRQPNPEEERARLNEELGRAILEIQQRIQSDQALVEGRLLSEMATVREGEERLLSEIATVREAEDRLVLRFQAMQQELPSQLRLDERLAPVVSRQQQQDEALSRADAQFAALQESLDLLSIQLRERTGTLAAESQTNYASLANRVQEYLDALAEQFETRTAMIEADWQQRLDVVANRVPDVSPEFLRLGEQMAELEQRSVNLDEQFAALTADSEARLAALAAESQTNMTALALRFQEQEATLDRTFAERLAAVEQLPGLAAAVAQLPALAAQVNDIESAVAALGETRAQLPVLADQVTNLESAVVTLGEMRAQLPALADQVTNLESAVVTLGEMRAQLPALADQIAGLESSVVTLGETRAQLPALAAQLAQLEETVAKQGNARELMPMFDRLEQELELRQAEEVRLANLIGTQEGRFAPISTALEESRETSIKLLSRLSDMERTVEETRRGAQEFNDNWKPILTEVSRRVGPLTERLTVLNNSVLKSEASLQSLNSDQSEMRETLTTLADQVQRGRTENARQLEAWQVTIDEHKDTIERFTQQWLTLSNQYKEARMAVQNFAHWQKQLEQQKREASEMLRIESNRMQSRWDGFLLEIQEKLKNFELDLSQKWQAFELENEQKWAGARRSEQVWREELGAVDELIQKLQQDNRNLIWRVQAAQADAIKKWPRLLMEEVEKAVELNPNRRLSPTGASPRGDMSVVDAIEQGLITIDYANDSTGDR
jgi:chromosome segregation ATPase